MLIGIDTGGTFTDFVVFDGERLRIHKRLSTPEAPERAILDGIADLGLLPQGLDVVHGSTVATNAALEGKGVRTAFITNRGLGDMLTIGRQARRELYNLQPGAQTPPVAAELCLETGGRLAADGTVIEPLTADDLARLGDELRRLKPAAVAINLLLSFLDDRFERQLAESLPAGVFVACSSAVLPEMREYERGIATWLNAWLGPLMAGYLLRLCDGLPGGRVSVMQSSGGTIRADQAAQRAVNLLLSGPAGGLTGARLVGMAAGRPQLLTFDMGGTSTDVALVDGEVQLTSEGHIGPWPVGVPMVDMHTIGAGGGSIASVDTGGLLQVGPESAGASPGPACYGLGGTRATVTDANLVLGRLQAEAFLGGDMMLDMDAARFAVSAIARQLVCDIEQAAAGIIRVANEHMARALRVISVQRGIDPRGYTLASFGGAGGLHVCALADALGIQQALVPVHAGVLSALGMLAARRSRQLSQASPGPFDEEHAAVAVALLDKLAGQGRDALCAEGVDPDRIERRDAVDLRYPGQSYTLTLPWEGIVKSTAGFHELHTERFGHRLELPVELVNVRVAVQGPDPGVVLPATATVPPGSSPEPVSQTALPGDTATAAVYAREQLCAGHLFSGPALVTEAVATTWLAPGWQCNVDRIGNLLLGKSPATGKR